MNSRRLMIPLVALFIFFIVWMGSKIGDSQKSWDWSSSLDQGSPIPYGTLLFENLLEASAKDYTDVSHGYKAWSHFSIEDTGLAYVGLRYDWNPDDSFCSLAMNFVKRGNTVVLATDYPPSNLLDKLYLHSRGQLPSLSYSKLTMNHLVLSGREGNPDTFRFRFHNDTALKSNHHGYNWKHIPGLESFARNLVPEAGPPKVIAHCIVGPEDSLPFAIQLNYGKGAFIFHSNPILLSNYFLKSSMGFRHVQSCFSILVNKKIYFETRRYFPRQRNYTNKVPNDGPFSFIMSQRPLRWAFMTALALLLLYLFFQFKRKQRAIPPLYKAPNASLAYIKTLGRLSFVQGNKKHLCQKLINQWVFYNRERYGLNTKTVDDHYLQRLSQRSGIRESDLKMIVEKNQKIQNLFEGINNKSVNDLYQSLQEYYKNCK